MGAACGTQGREEECNIQVFVMQSPALPLDFAITTLLSSSNQGTLYGHGMWHAR